MICADPLSRHPAGQVNRLAEQTAKVLCEVGENGAVGTRHQAPSSAAGTTAIPSRRR
jgi:hypothetical protein